MDEHAMALDSTERWMGRLQVRVTLAVIFTLVPLLVVMTWLTLYFQRQDMERLLLEKAESIAISGAANIGYLWERAIADGDLTREQVFDTNYVRFWTYDPATYPEFEGDSQSLDKYHTQYDAYTDEHWQDLLDAYLTSDDIIFTVALDVNGYIPTHNRRWSSGDGNPATDRTKRIFNDPVGITAARNTEPLLQQVYQRPGTGETLWDVSAPIYVYGEHWGVFRVGMELTQNQARVATATWRTVIIMAFVVLIVGGVAWGIGHYVADPIILLTQAALRAAGGDLEQHIDIANRNEITLLAHAFNTMTTQLRETLAGLEHRVAERTQGLLTAAEVSSATTAVLDMDALLPQVVELVRERFNLYYVGVFLTDEAGEYAILRAGSGQAGRAMLARNHRLAIGGDSMIGRCVLRGQADIQLDVGTAAVRFDNPDLPDTRSELALPLRAGSQVIGALTVQSEQEAFFSQEDISVMQTVADQVANAVRNARLFQQVQDSLESERRAYSELTQDAWRNLLQARPDLGFMSNRQTTLQTADVWRPEMKEALRTGQLVPGQDATSTLAIPIKVRNQVVGVIDGRKPDGTEWTPEEITLLAAMTDQLNVALESAQLYQDSQRRAAREQLVGEVTARMRETLDIERILHTAAGELRSRLGLERLVVRLGTPEEQEITE